MDKKICSQKISRTHLRVHNNIGHNMFRTKNLCVFICIGHNGVLQILVPYDNVALWHVLLVLLCGNPNHSLLLTAIIRTISPLYMQCQMYNVEL